MKKILLNVFGVCLSLVAILSDISFSDEVMRYNVGIQIGKPLVSADNSLGFNLFYFEYIGKSGWGLQISPLNFYGYDKTERETFQVRTATFDGTVTSDVDIGSFYYLPLTIKYSFQNKDPMPYLGLGIAYHEYYYNAPFSLYLDERDEESKGLVPVLNFGFNCFPRQRIGFTVDAKFSPSAGGSHESNILVLSGGVSINW